MFQVIVIFDFMDKRQFLQQEYLNMLASGTHVCLKWRSGFENFYDDMVDATPTHPARRFLMFRDAAIGFEPGNVEWHFRRSHGSHQLPTRAVKETERTTKAKKGTAPSKSRREETRRIETERRKEERRKMIADQYRRWEENRLRR